MSDENLISAVVNLYKDGLSFEKIAGKLKISTAKVRKALLSARVWTNETAELVARTRNAHPDWSDQRIADKLNLSLNSVQMYTPYKYGPQDEENRSVQAEKVALYRERNRGLVENPDENRRDIADLIDELEDEDEEEDTPMVLPPKFTGKPNVDEDFFINYRLTHAAQGRSWHSLAAMKLRLSVDTSGMTPEEICDLEKFYSVKTGWYRDVIVNPMIPLHYLHYVIQNAFGFNNVGHHYFSLPDEEFSEITRDSLTEYCRLCGILFRFPFGNDEKEMRWDDDYNAKTSLRTWMKSKYNSFPFPTHAGTGYTYGDNQYRIWEWAKPFDFHPLKCVTMADDAQEYLEKHGIDGYTIGDKADSFDEEGQFPYNNILENIMLERILSITHLLKFNVEDIKEIEEPEIIEKLFMIEEAREAMKEAEAIRKLIKKKKADGDTLVEKVWKEKAKKAAQLYFLCESVFSLAPFTSSLTYTFDKWKINIELIEEYYDDSVSYMRNYIPADYNGIPFENDPEHMKEWCDRLIPICMFKKKFEVSDRKRNSIVPESPEDMIIPIKPEQEPLESDIVIDDRKETSVITDDYLYKALKKVILEKKAVCIAKEGKEINRRSCSVDKLV